jgi:hypothetical protein
MKYFEFDIAYYAMIGAETLEEAALVYREYISDEDDVTTLCENANEIDRDLALIIYARALSEDGDVASAAELRSEFNTGGMLIVDSSLL